MEHGPWLFRDWAVILAPYDGISDPDSVVLEFMPVWIQIHKIPEAYRKKEVVTQLVNRQAGEVITIEMIPVGGFKGGFVRVRMKKDVRKPLTRFVSISLGGKRSVFAVKYEKLGMLCFACGLIGHEYKKCGTGVFEDKELEFGDWIHAFPWRGRVAGPTRGVSSGRDTPMYAYGRGAMNDFNSYGRGFPGRGTTQGRGNFVDWRHHPERRFNPEDMELSYAASSPIKPGVVGILHGCTIDSA
jgi:hypothetical protein